MLIIFTLFSEGFNAGSYYGLLLKGGRTSIIADLMEQEGDYIIAASSYTQQRELKEFFLG
ncbi:hypothetical protein [Ruminiclostridium cellobioparum]|uniref:hypothetical protein n=1 Tax=Ruminiclostridium cellobioparum TaxID=29355 RepID=UPI0003488B44|nr:hypothetical protein [Ruminiclostridium cellobioparum]